VLNSNLPPILHRFRDIAVDRSKIAQTVGWIEMKLGMEVSLGPGQIVLDGDPAHPKMVTDPQFSAHVCCGQTAGWIKMPLSMEEGLSPDHIVLDGNPAPPPPERGTAALHFWAYVYFDQTAAWIKMPLGTKVGLGSGYILLDEDPAPHP